MTHTSATIWRGWYRPSKRHRWQQLASAADYGDCLGALLDATDGLPSGAELLVSSADPNVPSPAGSRPRRRY